MDTEMKFKNTSKKWMKIPIMEKKMTNKDGVMWPLWKALKAFSSTSTHQRTIHWMPPLLLSCG
jgi:hypothetical protein